MNEDHKIVDGKVLITEVNDLLGLHIEEVMWTRLVDGL